MTAALLKVWAGILTMTWLMLACVGAVALWAAFEIRELLRGIT